MVDYINGKFEPNGLPGYSGVPLGNSGNMSKRKKMCINIGIIVALVLAMVGLIMGTYFAYSIISQFENTAGLGRIRVRIRFG